MTLLLTLVKEWFGHIMIMLCVSQFPRVVVQGSKRFSAVLLGALLRRYLPEPEARSVTWRNPRPPAHRKKDCLTLARALTRASRSPPAPRSVGC